MLWYGWHAPSQQVMQVLVSATYDTSGSTGQFLRLRLPGRAYDCQFGDNSKHEMHLDR